MVRKKFEELTFTDDFMFCEVMQNLEIASAIIELVTAKRIYCIDKHQTQSAHQGEYGMHGVRFDVEFIGDATVYDIEMQTYADEDMVRRARFLPVKDRL